MPTQPALLALVQRIVSPETESKSLYLSDCPFNAAYYNMYREGDGLGWHFDKGIREHMCKYICFLSTYVYVYKYLCKFIFTIISKCVRVCIYIYI